jgi:putative DNA-invertase from lambdoid prophage Rac
MATFAYGRVSTADQNPENQRLEIERAGFKIDYWFAEKVSGSVSAKERPQFIKMLDKIRSGETLVVSKLDRLGRNAMDVRATVEELEAAGIRVHCLALGGVDLTSAAGKMTMQVLNAVAEFERDLLIERTQSGLARAKAQGKTLGRPSKTTPEQRAQIVADLANGVSVSELARRHNVSRANILNVAKSQEAK